MIAEEARGLENEQRFVLFVCMLCCMKCVELTLLSYLIAHAFHVIRVICHIACHYIGVNRPTTRKECFWVESNGDASANMSTVYQLMSKKKGQGQDEARSIWHGHISIVWRDSRKQNKGSLKKKWLLLVKMTRIEAHPASVPELQGREKLSRS